MWWSHFRNHRTTSGLYACLILLWRCFVHESAPPVLTVFVVSANVVFSLWFHSPLKWNTKDGAGQIAQSVVREPCPTQIHSEEWGLRWEIEVKLLKIFCETQEENLPLPSCPLLLTLLLLHYCFSLPSPPHLPPWAVNVNGCISLSLNFTYDFPGAKHSKQAPLSLSWNAPGDATHFRRVTRTRPCRAGSDVYDL